MTPSTGRFAFRGGNLITSSGQIKDGLLLVDAGRIKYVGREKEHQIPPGHVIIDARGLIVSPGFIDLHECTFDPITNTLSVSR